MGFRINTNIDALTAYNVLAKINKETATALMRMASGKRINSVSDDTSGFSIGKSLDGKITVMKSALNNVSSAKNLLSTAEGSLLSTNDLLIKIEGKLSDAANPTSDRSSIADDVKALATEFKSVLETTKFNNTSLLTGSGGAKEGFVFQVGNTYTDKLTLDFASSMLSGSKTGFDASINNLLHAAESSVTTGATVAALQANISTLKSQISKALGKIGNFVQRLDIKEEVLNISMTNAQSSYSRLFDADMAAEQLNATRGNILGQAAISMLSQLNSAPNQILSLFR